METLTLLVSPCRGRFHFWLLGTPSAGKNHWLVCDLWCELQNFSSSAAFQHVCGYSQDSGCLQVVLSLSREIRSNFSWDTKGQQSLNSHHFQMKAGSLFARGCGPSLHREVCSATQVVVEAQELGVCLFLAL